MEEIKADFTAVKRLRVRLGMKQREFAKLFGVSSQAVCNWENQGPGSFLPNAMLTVLENHEKSFIPKGETGENGKD